MALRPAPARQRNAIERRHLDVGDDDIDACAVGFEIFERFGAILRDVHRVPVRGQRPLDEIAHGRRRPPARILAMLSLMPLKAAPRAPLLRQAPDERQLAITVRHVHAVADDECIWTFEGAEVGLDVDGARNLLFQQHAGQDRSWRRGR